MTHTAIVILSGNESHTDPGRLGNRLEIAKEFAETDGDEVEPIFDGAGTQWSPELEDDTSDYHERYLAVRDTVAAWDFCSSAFGVEVSGVITIDDHDGHSRVRSLVEEGSEIITF